MGIGENVGENVGVKTSSYGLRKKVISATNFVTETFDRTGLLNGSTTSDGLYTWVAANSFNIVNNTLESSVVGDRCYIDVPATSNNDLSISFDVQLSSNSGADIQTILLKSDGTGANELKLQIRWLSNTTLQLRYRHIINSVETPENSLTIPNIDIFSSNTIKVQVIGTNVNAYFENNTQYIYSCILNASLLSNSYIGFLFESGNPWYIDNLITKAYTLEKPFPVQGLRLTSVTSSSLGFTWNANALATSYEYQFNNSGIWVNNGLNTTASFGNLNEYTSYPFSVRAVNSVGPSNPVNMSATTAQSGAVFTPSFCSITHDNFPSNVAYIVANNGSYDTWSYVGQDTTLWTSSTYNNTTPNGLEVVPKATQTTGYGCGWTTATPETDLQGKTYTWQIKTYFPTGFSFNTNIQWWKFLRLSMSQPSDPDPLNRNNKLSIYAEVNPNTLKLRIDNEVDHSIDYTSTMPCIIYDAWQTWTLTVTFGVKGTNTSRIQMWGYTPTDPTAINGLIFDTKTDPGAQVTDFGLLKSYNPTTDYLNGFMFCTYWNGAQGDPNPGKPDLTPAYLDDCAFNRDDLNPWPISGGVPADIYLSAPITTFLPNLHFTDNSTLPLNSVWTQNQGSNPLPIYPAEGYASYDKWASYLRHSECAMVSTCYDPNTGQRRAFQQRIPSDHSQTFEHGTKVLGWYMCCPGIQYDCPRDDQGVGVQIGHNQNPGGIQCVGKTLMFQSIIYDPAGYDYGEHPVPIPSGCNAADPGIANNRKFQRIKISGVQNDWAIRGHNGGTSCINGGTNFGGYLEIHNWLRSGSSPMQYQNYIFNSVQDFPNTLDYYPYINQRINTTRHTTTTIPAEYWNTYHVLIHFAADNTGWIKVWFNQVLVVDEQNIVTCNDTSATFNSLTYIDPWNSGPNKIQYQYFEGWALHLTDGNSTDWPFDTQVPGAPDIVVRGIQSSGNNYPDGFIDYGNGTWSWYSSFEGMTINDVPWTSTSTGSSVTDINTRTLITGTSPKFGGRCVESPMAVGEDMNVHDNNAVDWRWNRDFGKSIGQGEEIWVRFFVRISDNFPYSMEPKLMRIRTSQSTGVNLYQKSDRTTIEIWTTPPSGSVGEFWSNWDLTNNPTANNIGGKIGNNWVCFECYQKLHSTPGSAITRVWRDGTLMFEDTITRTLVTATDTLQSLALTFYTDAGSSPVNVSHWIDDVVITTAQPSNIDANGYPYIGTTSGKPQGAPPIYTRYVTFETGSASIGSPANDLYYGNDNNDNFDYYDNFGGTSKSAWCTYSNDMAWTGTTSAKLILPKNTLDTSFGGSVGYGALDKAGIIESQPLVVGDEIWFQCKIWFDQTYVDAGGLSTSAGPKGFRLRNSNDPSKWNTWYLKPNGNPFPVGSDTYWWSLGDGDTIPPSTNIAVGCAANGGSIPVVGKWETFEFYIKVGHATSPGELRCWRNNHPCELWAMTSYYNFTGPAYSQVFNTIKDDGSDHLDGGLAFFGQWNGGNPNSEDALIYTDAHVMCINKVDQSITDVPANTDSNGFRFIGSW